MGEKHAPDEITLVDKRKVLDTEREQGLEIQQWRDHANYCGTHKDCETSTDQTGQNSIIEGICPDITLRIYSVQ